MTKENSLRGKKARAAGGRFELKVRKDLEAKGWIVDKWSNNVEFELIKPTEELGSIHKGIKIMEEKAKLEILDAKLIPAKRRYNPFSKALAIGTGFPDFICFKKLEVETCAFVNGEPYSDEVYEIIGVESKSNGTLDKEEKAKCVWYLENNIFSKILIAKKGTKRGEIEYVEFKNEK